MIGESTNFEVLLKKGKPIYVINKTKPAAVISLTLSDRNGDKKYGAIPPTFIPIDLTALFPRSYLKESFDIRQYFLKGIMEIIPQEKAEKLLSTSDAQEELARITKSSSAGRNVNAAMKDLRSANKDMRRLSREADLNSSIMPDAGEAVSDRVRDICLRMETDSLNPTEALAEMKSIQNELTESDYQYILTTSESSKIKKWVKTKLASEATNENTNKTSKKKSRSVDEEEGSEEEDEESDSSDEDEDGEFDDKD